VSQQVDYEAELAVIIGKKARFVKEADAFNYIAGYTIVNDISARDVQFSDGQWIRGKSFDTFCPMGPFMVTADEIADPHTLAIQCRVNGRTLQDSNTAEMIFKIPFLIEFISSFCTLYPGDIISTGTPHGVGAFREPKIFLKTGDVVEVEIEGIGSLQNKVVQGSS
jgi:acylpyruvate hydrolase